ncbi:Plakophilin-1 [Oryzias melastigma]|uniref:Plakophilin-1 n=1 Tax=Oryzias melastigma TaxID=30732 RepID=A0A834KVX3_ORYME|nr:Plakophilin-1 [Oryzias melastigma]
MTALDPLKSVMALGNVDDTSLALPSRHKQLTGEQRVREQVQTIKRTKSRHLSSRSGSTSMSPTSPLDDSVFVDFAKSSTSNGSVFLGNGYSKNHIQEKSMNKQSQSCVKKQTGYHYERRYGGPVGALPVGQRNTSRSEPDLVWRRSVVQPSVPSQRMVSNKNSYVTRRSTSQYITGPALHPQPLHLPNGSAQTKMNGKINGKINGQVISSKTNISRTQSRPSMTESSSKIKGHSGVNGNSVVTDITVKDAVKFLSSEDEEYQYCGASFIQHNTYNNDKAKEEVLQLKGIPALVNLVCSPCSRVSLTASAALRNLSFKNDSTKEEIHHCGGITKAVEQLKASKSVDLHKQLTGLLWNLSSSDNLRPDLLKSALPVLMPDPAGPQNTKSTERPEKDPDVFYHATGCFRNLSCAKQNSRQFMRTHPGLIDSLVSYVEKCVAAEKPDDLSVENCVCVLHNLTFQLETEAPSVFKRINALANQSSKSQTQNSSSSVGCFSSPSKAPEVERCFDYPSVEDPQPSGAGWLIHSKTLSSYLSLLKRSKREETLEACCGAMRNLTAHEGIVFSVLSQIIVKNLNGMQIITPLLRSSKVNLQKNMLTLVSNLMKNPNLQSAIGGKALPELLDLLRQGPSGAHDSDDNLALACQIASCLITKEPERNKKHVNSSLIKSLTDLSENRFMPKSSKAAGVLLYKIWSDKDLQSFLKKQGMSKSSFVNDITVAAYKSAQVVD